MVDLKADIECVLACADGTFWLLKDYPAWYGLFLSQFSSSLPGDCAPGRRHYF
jgi:hypothetical protein